MSGVARAPLGAPGLQPPGPRRVVFMRRHPQTFLKLARKYGDVVRWRIGPREIWLVSRPDLVAQIFRDSYTHFEKDWGPRRGSPMFGNGLLTSEREEHRAQRRDFSRIFARPSIEAKRAEIAAAIGAWSERQRDGAEVDLFHEMSRLGSDVAARLLFGCAIGHDEANEAVDAIARRFRRVMFPYADRVRLKRDTPWKLAHLVAHVKAHRSPDALLGGEDLPDDQIATFLVASQETLRIALTFSWLMLDRHPQFRDADPESVLLESMRLHPPQWMIGRRTIAPYPLDGYEIPRGALVLVSPFILHRDARWFEEPERFDPARWQKPPVDRNAYLPFGSGPRRCIGEVFSMVAGTTVLSMLAREWRFECASGKVRYEPRLTLQPTRVTARLRRVTGPAPV